jgi:hypothetical protein
MLYLVLVGLGADRETSEGNTFQALRGHSCAVITA